MVRTITKEPSRKPPGGWLIAAGGGVLDDSVLRRFVDLAGGAEARIVIIPTASRRETFSDDLTGAGRFRGLGAGHLQILHTRDRRIADSAEFVEPLREATGVWLGGGRQWRLVDSYLGTSTHRLLGALLKRGGVIGGTSAGATILGSYLVRGAREGNQIMMAPGYEEGFGFLPHTAIDQHLLQREREYDLVEVIKAKPELLGIGLDEGAAIVVHGDRFEVIGRGGVAIYDIGYMTKSSQAPFYFLSVGNAFDLGSLLPDGTGGSRRRPPPGPNQGIR